jgi:antitoxin component YwqK of YwqJK toxin-antitoxin module
LTESLFLNAQDTAFYSNGVVKEIFKLNMNGVKDGPTKYFDELGRIRETGFYEIGEKVGEWRSYYTNGQIEEVCYYESFLFHYSRKVGPDTLYYEDGQLYEILNWKNGKLHGMRKWFHQNGQLWFIHHYKDGEYVGKWKWYYVNGNLEKIERYSQKGQANGKWKKYYENGKIAQKSRWRNDLEVGIWKYYYENGKLKRTQSQMTGKEQCYDRRRHKINCDLMRQLE